MSAHVLLNLFNAIMLRYHLWFIDFITWRYITPRCNIM